MKVGMLTTTGDRCGIAAYTSSLIESLSSLVDLEIVPIQPGQHDIATYQAQANRLNSCDVIHIQHEHSFWGGILPGKSAFWNLRYLLTKPVVTTAHTTTSLEALFKLKEERRLPHKIAKQLLVMRKRYRDSVETAPFITGRCIVHTDEAKIELCDRGANPKYVHVLPAGIPMSPLKGNPERFRTRFHCGDSVLITLFGFVAVNKGYELVIKALPLLPDNVRFVIAGGVRTDADQSYLESLLDIVNNPGMNDRVIITGYLDEQELADAMAASEIVLAPHTFATGSYSVTVPIGFGKPLVASNLACFTELRKRGANIAVFANKDASALGKSINLLLSNSELRSSMSVTNKQFAIDNNWDAVATKTIAVYEEAILDEDRLRHHAPVSVHK